MHCNGYGHLRTWEIGKAGKTLYRVRSYVVVLSLHLKNKQQIMQNNLETQNKHMFS